LLRVAQRFSEGLPLLRRDQALEDRPAVHFDLASVRPALRTR
jgi:hypothetical protein